MRRILERPGAVLGAILLWKLLLLAFPHLPPPSNDSFFYDGPAVNLVLHGRYVNPSLEMAMPISSREVFAAYPPLYPLFMSAWMSVWGVSALSAMWLHFLLFAAAAVLVLTAGRALRLPSWSLSLGLTFFLCISFHDRPDSLAHVFGIGSVYGFTLWLMSGRTMWIWSAMVAVLLALATGLQIGALYFAIFWLAVLLGVATKERPVPTAALLFSLVIPALLLAWVILGHPRAWSGFLEHAAQTPSITGWRVPRLDDFIKLARALPGVLAVGLWSRPMFVARAMGEERLPKLTFPEGTAGLLLCALLVPSLSLALASMLFFTPNGVSFATYVQPLIVSLGLAHCRNLTGWHRRLVVVAALALAMLGSLRMFGLSTWGALCAKDVGYRQAAALAREALTLSPAGTPVVSSAAYMYDLASANARLIHCDWLAPAGRDQERIDVEGLASVRPAVLILTQFDYYRRYEPLLERVRASGQLQALKVRNHSGVTTPDAVPPLRRVLQHIAWAPVVVELTWAIEPGSAKPQRAVSP